MRWLVAIIVSTGCYSPQLQPCEVTCGSDSPCPADLTCGNDHFCHSGADNTCNVTLSITTDGDGDGRVTSMPDGVDCDSSSSGQGCDDIPFAAGTSITLTETHSGGNNFAHWSGDACNGSSASTCTFTIETAMTVNATFF